MMKSKINGTHTTIFCVSLFLILISLRITPLLELELTSDGTYPILVSVLCMFFALWVIAEDNNKIRKKNMARGGAKTETCRKDIVFTREILFGIGMLVLYGVAIHFVGYIIATLVFSILSITFLNNGRWKTGLLTGFIVTFLVVLVFKYFFRVILP